MTDIASNPLEPSGTALGPTSVAAVAVAARGTPAPWRLLARKPTFIVGAAILLFWIVCAIFGHAIAPYNPLAQQLLGTTKKPLRVSSNSATRRFPVRATMLVVVLDVPSRASRAPMDGTRAARPHIAPAS